MFTISAALVILQPPMCVIRIRLFKYQGGRNAHVFSRAIIALEHSYSHSPLDKHKVLPNVLPSNLRISYKYSWLPRNISRSCLKAGQPLLAKDMSSHWQKSQIRRLSDCCSADFGPRLPANKLYN